MLIRPFVSRVCLLFAVSLPACDCLFTFPLRLFVRLIQFCIILQGHSQNCLFCFFHYFALNLVPVECKEPKIYSAGVAFEGTLHILFRENMTISVHDVTLKAQTVCVWAGMDISSQGGDRVPCQLYQTRMAKKKKKQT
jgi:hypothetical protein